MKTLTRTGLAALVLALSPLACRAEMVFELFRNDAARVLTLNASGGRILGALVPPASTGTLIGVDFSGFSFSPSLTVDTNTLLFQATSDSGVAAYDFSGGTPQGMLRLASPLTVASAADGGTPFTLTGGVTFNPLSPGDWALLPGVGSTGGLDFLRPPGPGGNIIEPGPDASGFWIIVPEPGTGSFALLGGLSALLLRRRGSVA